MHKQNIESQEKNLAKKVQDLQGNSTKCANVKLLDFLNVQPNLIGIHAGYGSGNNHRYTFNF